MILLYISFLLAIGFVITPRIVEATELHTIADKDSYIDNAAPARNWGDNIVLKAGYGPPLFEAYIHFNLTNKPSDFIKAELFLQILRVQETSNFTLSITDGNWNEMKICWNNKPAHLQTLGDITVSEEGYFRIDLTSLLAASTTISFCINKSAGHLFEDDISIASNNRGVGGKPRIIWTYEGPEPEVPFTSLPGYNVFVMIGIISIVVSVFFAMNKMNYPNKNECDKK